jgi:hypothetical protein
MYLKCIYPYATRRNLFQRLFRKNKTYEIPPSLEGRYNDLIGVMISWMRERNFIGEQLQSDSVIKFKPSTSAIGGSLYLGIATFNLRRLVLDTQDENGRTPLENYLHLISDNANGVVQPLSDFINLIDSLVAFYPEELLDCIINKIYRALCTFGDKEEWDAWVYLHQTQPFLWVTFLVQFLLYRYSDPRMMVQTR